MHAEFPDKLPVHPPINAVGDQTNAHALTTDAVAKLVSLREFPPKGPEGKETWEALTERIPDLKQRATQHLISNQDIGILADQCPALNRLNLAGNPLISDEALAHLIHLSALKSLNLASTEVHNLIPLADRLPALEEVNFFNTRLEPDAFQQFLAHTHLHICTLPEDTPSGIFSEIHLDSLEEIGLIVGNSLTFEDFLDLLSRAPLLQRVRLQVRKPVTSEQLQAFVERAAQLKKIDLLGDPDAIKPSLKKSWQTALKTLGEKGIEISGQLADSLH